MPLNPSVGIAGASGEMFGDDDVVELLDHFQEGGRLVVARVGEVVVDDLADMAGARAHDDDAVGEEDGFFDDVGDDHDGFEVGDAAGLGGRSWPRLRRRGRSRGDRLRSGGFGGEDVECGERFIHAEEFGAAGEGAGDADALFHAAGEFFRIGIFVAFEADDVDAAR